MTDIPEPYSSALELSSASIEFVKKIANESPIYADDWINRCTFCQVSWCEDSYVEYLANEQLLAENPEVRHHYNRDYIKHQHHDEDCLWVEANRILVNP